MSKGKILEIEEVGASFKLNDKGELLCNGMYNDEGTLNDNFWEHVEDFYPIVVEKVNSFFGTDFKANITLD